MGSMRPTGIGYGTCDLISWSLCRYRWQFFSEQWFRQHRKPPILCWMNLSKMSPCTSQVKVSPTQSPTLQVDRLSQFICLTSGISSWEERSVNHWLDAGVTQSNTDTSGKLGTASSVGNLVRIRLNDDKQLGKWQILTNSPQPYTVKVTGPNFAHLHCLR